MRICMRFGLHKHDGLEAKPITGLLTDRHGGQHDLPACAQQTKSRGVHGISGSMQAESYADRSVR